MFIHQPIRDPIAIHTRKLIAFLEERIKEDFSMDVKIGFEKEFFIKFDPEPNFRDPTIKDEMASIVKKINEFRKDKQRPGKDPIEKVFLENPLFPFFEINTVPAPPLTAVERIDMQSSRLEAFTQRFLNDPRSRAHNNLQEKIVREIGEFVKATGTQEVFFTPKDPIINRFMAGIHVNCSVWKNGHNQTSKVEDYIKAALNAANASDAILVTPNQDAIKRFNIGDVQEAKENYDGSSDRDRVEWRLPANNARHDLSVLVVMTAIYDALKKHKAQEEPKILTPHVKLKDAEDGMKKFNKSITMKRLQAIAEGNEDIIQSIESLKKQVSQAAQAGKLTQPTLFEPSLAV